MENRLGAQQGKESAGQTARVALAYTHRLHAAPLAVHSGGQMEPTASGKLPTVDGRQSRQPAGSCPQWMADRADSHREAAERQQALNLALRDNLE